MKDPTLYPEFGYTSMVYLYDDAAKRFEAWFNNDFMRLHPNSAVDFDLDVSFFDGETYLEVLQHNVCFSVDALQELYYASLRPAPRPESKLKAVS